MRGKAFLIILVIIVLGLGAALVVNNQHAVEETKKRDAAIKTLSNTVVEVKVKRDELVTVNTTLSNILATKTAEYSNKLIETEADRDATAARLAKAQAEAKAAADAAKTEMEARDKKIADLEGQNLTLDKQATDLRGSISKLESQINATEHKLANSEGERSFLLKELDRMRAEKADLEKKFNDLATLRDQVHKLKEELSISRRLDWIRRGIADAFSHKGGERQIAAKAEPASVNSDLNVEIKQDGTSTISTPAPSGSDAPNTAAPTTATP
jgi:chromosome segregation ATPase